MPNARFYVRNHFADPDARPGTWRLEVGGLVERPLRLSLRDLQTMPSQTLVATLECAGNGRSMFEPARRRRAVAARSGQHRGVDRRAAGRGARPRRGPTGRAWTVVFRGADRGTVEGRPDPIRFERSLSLDDARSSEALLAYAMNGEPLPVQHGYPLRLVVPGWYAVASVKWLTEIEVIGDTFDGFFQTDRYVYEWERDGDDGPSSPCACSGCGR